MPASFQSATYLGYQQISGLSAVTALTLPTGAQAASGSSCNLSGNLLTVGGTITGAFAQGLVVTGTGIPVNTTIIAQASPNQWWLSNPCSTENGVPVAASMDAGANVAVITVEGAGVRYLPGGGVPTSSVGVPVSSGSQLIYDAGDLAGLRFIQTAVGAILNVLYYRVAAPN